MERLTISDSVVFERVLGAGGRVVSLLVGIVLEDMVPAGCLLCLTVPGDRALKQLCDSKTSGDFLISGLIFHLAKPYLKVKMTQIPTFF